MQLLASLMFTKISLFLTSKMKMRMLPSYCSFLELFVIFHGSLPEIWVQVLQVFVSNYSTVGSFVVSHLF